jgi:hypothetical protein
MRFFYLGIAFVGVVALAFICLVSLQKVIG